MRGRHRPGDRPSREQKGADLESLLDTCAICLGERTGSEYLKQRTMMGDLVVWMMGGRGGRVEMDKPPGGQQSGEPPPHDCRGGC